MLPSYSVFQSVVAFLLFVSSFLLEAQLYIYPMSNMKISLFVSY